MTERVICHRLIGSLFRQGKRRKEPRSETGFLTYLNDLFTEGIWMAQLGLATLDSKLTGKNRTLSPINDLAPCLFCPLPAQRIVETRNELFALEWQTVSGKAGAI